MTEDEAEEWLDRMMRRNGYRDGHLLSDDRYVCIATFLFTDGIIEGEVGDDYGYYRRWCYHKPMVDMAMKEWQGRDFEDEPIGWTRRI